MCRVFCLLLVLVAVTRAARLPFIAEGKDVNPVGKWPWQGSLQFLAKGHICGCIILSETWMLTGTSCFMFGLPSLTTVLLGAHDINTKTKGEPSHYRIAEYIKHPEYLRGHYMEPDLNDIGLIRLSSPADFGSPFIQPAVLATADNSQIFTDCYITGWGKTHKEGFPSPVNVLKEAKAHIITNEVCHALCRPLKDTHLCVAGDSGACFFDNGGPVVCRPHPDDIWLVVGVLANKQEVCIGGRPTVCTRVSKYREWITDATDGEIPVA